jgi:hypothetical protein
MICNISCVISIIFIIANLYFNYSVYDNKVMDKYEKTLNEKQLIVYKKIVQERLTISIYGYIIGLILSIFIIIINYKYYKINKKIIICLVGSITFIVHYFYYTLSPKSDWMLLHIEKEQNKDWLNMYNTMKKNYHFSFVVGIISVMLLANSFRC